MGQSSKEHGTAIGGGVLFHGTPCSLTILTREDIQTRKVARCKFGIFFFFFDGKEMSCHCNLLLEEQFITLPSFPARRIISQLLMNFYTIECHNSLKSIPRFNGKHGWKCMLLSSGYCLEFLSMWFSSVVSGFLPAPENMPLGSGMTKLNWWMSVYAPPCGNMGTHSRHNMIFYDQTHTLYKTNQKKIQTILTSALEFIGRKV